MSRGTFPEFSARTEHLVEHNLMEMIFIVLCPAISGADNWVDVANWAEGKVDWLREKGLKLEYGTPSHDTFGRVFLRIDLEQFQTGFASWVKAAFEIVKGQIIAIDGKQMNGSKSKKIRDKSDLHGKERKVNKCPISRLSFRIPIGMRNLVSARVKISPYGRVTTIINETVN